jgi:hypothetical protein
VPGKASRHNGKKGGRPRTKVPATALEIPAERARPVDFPLENLTAVQARFVAESLIDRNASCAYRASHPTCSVATSHTNAARVLGNEGVAAAVKAGIAAQHRACHMDGDEGDRPRGHSPHPHAALGNEGVAGSRTSAPLRASRSCWATRSP